mmetsp:Transcript_7777/g.15978  ORF Transcript_7777/g.15978 Transcript_7777/m.15978 type:complete len:237 (+) Transcript_7777:847-1557(+)
MLQSFCLCRLCRLRRRRLGHLTRLCSRRRRLCRRCRFGHGCCFDSFKCLLGLHLGLRLRLCLHLRLHWRRRRRCRRRSRSSSSTAPHAALKRHHLVHEGQGPEQALAKRAQVAPARLHRRREKRRAAQELRGGEGVGRRGGRKGKSSSRRSRSNRDGSGRRGGRSHGWRRWCWRRSSDNRHWCWRWCCGCGLCGRHVGEGCLPCRHSLRHRLCLGSVFRRGRHRLGLHRSRQLFWV